MKDNLFKNPINDHEEEVSGWSILWAFLFGFFYFLYKGVWTHAIINLVLSLATYGFASLIYAFFAPAILRKHYLTKGYIPVKFKREE
jgi:hypothetical protein